MYSEYSEEVPSYSEEGSVYFTSNSTFEYDLSILVPAPGYDYDVKLYAVGSGNYSVYTYGAIEYQVSGTLRDTEDETVETPAEGFGWYVYSSDGTVSQEESGMPPIEGMGPSLIQNLQAISWSIYDVSNTIESSDYLKVKHVPPY